MEDFVEGFIADTGGLPARATIGRASHSPTTGMWPARNSGNANASIALTLAAIFSGSSYVPDR
jgi:hypothetical protein